MSTRNNVSAKRKKSKEEKQTWMMAAETLVDLQETITVSSKMLRQNSLIVKSWLDPEDTGKPTQEMNPVQRMYAASLATTTEAITAAVSEALEIKTQISQAGANSPSGLILASQMQEAYGIYERIEDLRGIVTERILQPLSSSDIEEFIDHSEEETVNGN